MRNISQKLLPINFLYLYLSHLLTLVLNIPRVGNLDEKR